MNKDFYRIHRNADDEIINQHGYNDVPDAVRALLTHHVESVLIRHTDGTSFTWTKLAAEPVLLPPTTYAAGSMSGQRS